MDPLLDERLMRSPLLGMVNHLAQWHRRGAAATPGRSPTATPRWF
jgi:hypothetical protein